MYGEINYFFPRCGYNKPGVKQKKSVDYLLLRDDKHDGMIFTIIKCL